MDPFDHINHNTFEKKKKNSYCQYADILVRFFSPYSHARRPEDGQN